MLGGSPIVGTSCISAGREAPLRLMSSLSKNPSPDANRRWFEHRRNQDQQGWTRGPATPEREETIHRREFPDALRRGRDEIHLGWQRPPLATDADTGESVHKREFPDFLLRARDLIYLGFQRGPISADFVEPQEPIQSREFPRDKWWFEPRREQSAETWLRSPLPADNDVAAARREFPADMRLWIPRRIEEILTWLRSPLPGNVEPQSGQTITVEPLAGCGSNLWRAYKRYIEDNYTWTRAPFEVPVVVEQPPIRGEFPVDRWWFEHRQNVRPHGGWTAEPNVSHWCEVGAAVLFTAANWGGAVQFFFEAYFRAFTGVGRARLFNRTDNVVVAGSEVTTANPIMGRVRSGPIALIDGREYIGQIHAETNVNATAALSTRIIGV